GGGLAASASQSISASWLQRRSGALKRERTRVIGAQRSLPLLLLLVLRLLLLLRRKTSTHSTTTKSSASPVTSIGLSKLNRPFTTTTTTTTTTTIGVDGPRGPQHGMTPKY